MSVIKSKRGVADAEFIHTARELQIFSIRKCVDFPKRYTFYVGQYIARMSCEIYDNVVRANHVFPEKQKDAQKRREYFHNALYACYSMVSQIELADELFGIEENDLNKWSALLDREIRLIEGVVQKDKDRYMNLKA